MTEILKYSTFLLILLNPFLVIVYLIDIMRKLSFTRFRNVLIRAGIISTLVFILFALLGDVIFSDVIHANFASFQIFGGIVFLLIGLQFVFKGGTAIEGLRGESKYVAGAIAMPILIGPGTISYSVIIGEHLAKIDATLSIIIAITVSVSIMILLKRLHDYIQPKSEELIERYFDISGRITSLVIGTISIDMIMKGINAWMHHT